MGASVAFAGLAACRQPEQSIVPYVRQPENFVPGKPLFFATAMTLGGYAKGVLVESHECHPTKIEGNPDHPSSLGATDVFMQASILGLYDPDRSQVVRNLGEVSTWSEFIGALQPVLTAAKAERFRSPPPHADHHLADTRRADPAGARAYPRSEVAPVGSGQSRQHARRARAWRSAATPTSSTT